MSGQHFEQAKRTAETLLHWAKMASSNTELQMNVRNGFPANDPKPPPHDKIAPEK